MIHDGRRPSSVPGTLLLHAGGPDLLRTGTPGASVTRRTKKRDGKRADGRLGLRPHGRARLTGPLAAGEEAAAQCDVGRAMKTYAVARMKHQHSCQHREDRGALTDIACATADLTGAIAKAAEQLSTQ